jgi:hypothetical protein
MAVYPREVAKMAAHKRKLWAGGILLVLGGTAAAAVSADTPTATQRASGTAPVEIRTEVIHKTVHKRAKAARGSEHPSRASRGRGRDEGPRATSVALPARSAASTPAAPAPLVSRRGEDNHGANRGRGGDDRRADDNGGGREHENEVEHEDDHGGGDE